MDEGTKSVIVFFLLFVFSGKPAEGQSLLDVCSTCHANATCDDKSDGSGKVCNCKYGFVGNGRTFCQDKDECQIGSSKICGQHTTCHNTFGSYYCTCLAGYSPSNNMAVFIPNDGTHCQDIDECGITGQCGEGAQCRNLEGSFDCSCQVGYKIHNGVEPFNPLRDKASCKVVICGPLALLEDTVLVSVTGTTYSSVATFICDEGFVWRRGDNSSVCGAEGLWSKPDMVCEEVDCGSPPAVPHSRLLWNKSTRMGTEVVYQCNSGYHNVGKRNVSICTAAGQWAGPSVLCREILCGNPPVIEFTGQVWSYNSTPGSTVLYFCKDGFYNKGGNNVSTCQENGHWTSPTLSCQEILCGNPPNLPHTGQVWKGSSTPGSTVIYYCKKEFYHSDGNNVSVCTINGYWTKPDISCKEVDCGKPPLIPNSVMHWDKISTVGSKVIYQCKPGYLSAGTGDVSVCSASGKWDGAPILCQAKCGPAPFLANSEVVWHNRSVVIHRCVAGYHSWRGSNVSVCGSSGEWQKATLRCIEIKPPINHLLIFNESCLQWKAEKYEEDTEVYKVTYTGSRDYQRSFYDKRKRFLSSKADQLKLCLGLLPVTNYSITITATSAKFTASVTTNTSLPVPPGPVVYYREFDTPLPTLSLRRSPNTLDLISLYQVFVLPVEGFMMFNCSSPAIAPPLSTLKSPAEYITAQFEVHRVGTEMNLTIGDGLLYGGFYNAPLESGKNYYIILRAVSQWKSALKSSCVLWAKVTATSYALRVSSLSAVATIGLVAVVIWGGYSIHWCFKKT
ncbi:sushi domain-containing protein 1 isoform X2 [Pundamilia nyererei]|uniref:Sushi domain-containing protein 1 isoform X2 n=1 Tax=Pundamilia nyererei TaxID=303518 RepID=A0A9Y6JGK9_9CICH|nr:PREDICTED: sushi domain-containing protein 1-like isoform X2 [Pundamilia nyererei]